MDQQRVAFQRIDHVEHVLAHLLERIVLLFSSALWRQQFNLFGIRTDDVIPVPVLDLQHHDALLRMQHHEIRMSAERPHRNVVPHPGIVFEAILQPLSEAQLPPRIEVCRTKRGDQSSHW